MCGRYTAAADPKTFAEQFDVEWTAPFHPPRYNAAPTQLLPVVLNEDRRRIQLLRWGLIPSWAKDESIGNRMINARAETLAEKPSFRAALKRRRCLVLADGFYEWRKIGREKTPMRIMLASKAPFAFAGLWEQWTSPAGETLRTFTIVTTSANELLATIHDRMPVILRPGDTAAWLDESTSVANALSLCKPYPTAELSAYPVSSRVNSPRVDDASLIEPAD